MNPRLAGALIAIVATGCSGEIRFSGSPTDSGVGAGESGVTCVVDSDCVLDGLHCDAVSHACVPCVTDAHCTDATKPRCDAATHECVECGTSSDCADGETCIPTRNECVPTCSLDHPTCPTTAPSCDTARGICVGCRDDTQCTTGDRLRCELQSGRCVACLSDADCHLEGKPRCDAVGGECVRCLTSVDCPAAAPFCEPDKHVCVAK